MLPEIDNCFWYNFSPKSVSDVTFQAEKINNHPSIQSILRIEMIKKYMHKKTIVPLITNIRVDAGNTYLFRIYKRLNLASEKVIFSNTFYWHVTI